MRAMVLEGRGAPLVMRTRDVPEPGAGEVLVRVSACGVCRTDLHVVDGELPGIHYSIVPGHEVVGRVAKRGAGVTGLDEGQRVGIPWLGATCGHCLYCRSEHENLCDNAVFTGLTRDGGYAEFVVANADYCVPLDNPMDDVALAPLLCAGIVGYRSYRAAGDGERLGLYGFGAAAHILAQVARAEGRRVFAFTRGGDVEAQALALSLGCEAALSSDEAPPEPLDAAIIFAPVGALVPVALAALRKGGTLVLGGIHMSDLPQMRYDLLWGERVIRSVANMTRADGHDFMALAAQVPIKTSVTPFALADANTALDLLRAGRLTGAAVLVP